MKKTVLASIIACTIAASALASGLHYFFGVMTVGGTFGGTNPVIQASPPSLNALNQTHASFLFTSGGTAGCPYQYTVSAGSVTSTLTSGTLSSVNQTTTGFQVPAFNALTITTGTANTTGWIPASSTLVYSASLADLNGNWSSTPGTCSVVYNSSTLIGYYSGQTPNDPFTHNSSTGFVGVDANLTGGTMTLVTVSGGTAATTSFSISGGTLNQVTLAGQATLGASITTAGTASTSITPPAGSKIVTVWPIAGSSNLIVGGGTVTLPSVPITLPITGGTPAVQSSSGTATVGTVFGG